MTNYTFKTLEGDTRSPAVTPEPAPEPTAAELGERIDAAIELLLFFKVGKRVQPAAVEVLITETIKRLVVGAPKT